MKCLAVIWALVFVVIVAACHRPSVESRPVMSQKPELVAIDSLMWRQPDSAFAMLLEFAASPEADSLNGFDGHYFQLLVSELLYKNDYEQTNRQELLKAVAYFDSVNDVFLNARSHYINGVGYYERDSVVEACIEYLKALEIMESSFDEKALTNTKAAFMFYTNNRLLELFSAQFMMDPAIACGENALAYCQKELSLVHEIPNTYYHIGRQYDKKRELAIARNYYSWAIEGMTDTNSLIYRDAVSIKALCDYQLGLGFEQPLDIIKQNLSKTESQEERMSRLLAIGAMFCEEGLYDSALHYFEPIFENETNVTVKIRVAESLRVVYDSLGENGKSDECMRFLANHKKPEGENKSMVSILGGLYKNYLDRKQTTFAEAERKKSIRKTIAFIVPIAFLIALATIVMAKHNSKQLLKQQQEEELRIAKGEAAATFKEEAICQLIMERVNEGQFKSKIDYKVYKDSALNKQQVLDLRLAVDRHFGQFTNRLKKAYPKLTNSDLDYCCLYLLGLTDADIAALMQRTYNTVFERNRKMRRIFGAENPLPITLMGLARSSLFV